MGAWDVGIFDNDTACEWAYELHDAVDLRVVRHAIEAVLVTGSDYLDAEVAARALAACEVVARLRGRGGVRDSSTAIADAWVEEHPQDVPAEVVAHAIEAVDRVLAQPSELLELWEESADAERWHAVVSDLRVRLGGDSPSR